MHKSEHKMILDENGVFKEYDDTFDITVHCANQEQQDEAIRRLSLGWIPVEERLPEPDEYILVSFQNSPRRDIGKYEKDDEGGAFYPVDMNDAYTSFDLFVNAWMPIPRPYRREDESLN